MDLEESSEPEWAARPPSAFDIATCYFPEVGKDAKQIPKLRPSLILNVFQGKSDGRFACDVAFGTSRLKFHRRKGIDIIIQNHTDIGMVGLSQATRFDLDHIIKLPWTREFFDCWSGFSSPIIGSLTEEYIKEYAFCMMQRQRDKND